MESVKITWGLNVTTPRLRYDAHWRGSSASPHQGRISRGHFVYAFEFSPSPSHLFFFLRILSFTPSQGRSIPWAFSHALSHLRSFRNRAWPFILLIFLDNFWPEEDCCRPHLDCIPAGDLFAFRRCLKVLRDLSMLTFFPSRCNSSAIKCGRFLLALGVFFKWRRSYV